jgi:hypothetical protein
MMARNNPPLQGRGTIRRMVEGRAAVRPSTPPLRVAVPLPLQERI